MTLSAIGYLAALLIFVAGAAVAMRFDGRRRQLTLAGALTLAIVVGWFAWLVGTSA
jgi:hypothetical protein